MRRPCRGPAGFSSASAFVYIDISSFKLPTSTPLKLACSKDTIRGLSFVRALQNNNRHPQTQKKNPFAYDFSRRHFEKKELKFRITSPRASFDFSRFSSQTAMRRRGFLLGSFTSKIIRQFQSAHPSAAYQATSVYFMIS